MSVEMVVAVIGALCAGIVTIIASIGALVVSLNNGRAIEKDAKEKEKLIKDDAAIKSEKLEQIHILVNSRLSEALKEIADLRIYVAQLTGTPKDSVIADKAITDAKLQKTEDAQGFPITKDKPKP